MRVAQERSVAVGRHGARRFDEDADVIHGVVFGVVEVFDERRRFVDGRGGGSNSTTAEGAVDGCEEDEGAGLCGGDNGEAGD